MVLPSAETPVALLALPGAEEDGALQSVQDYPLQPGLPLPKKALG